MSKKRVLLMYISDNSGHHRACLAIEKALLALSDNVETFIVDSFHYTNPVLEKIIGRTYLSIIHKKPEFWGYLYDNPEVVRRTQNLRATMQRYSSGKMKALLEEFRPDAAICSQAFPCVLVADYKKAHSAGIVLAGVLTDYAPHYYWLNDAVDFYFAPSSEAKEKLVSNGISEKRVEITGIPIDPKFAKRLDKRRILESLGLSETKPVILVMGGSKGLGPIPEIVKALNATKADFELIIVTGDNKKLYRYLTRRSERFTKKTLVLGYSDNIDELMEVSSLIIGKPGGITISEALSKGLPILVIRPIPGHEQMNTDHLVRHKVAIRIRNLLDVGVFVQELLSSPRALANMQERARSLARPNSAREIAKTILDRIS